MQKKHEKICKCQKNVVPLHSNSEYGTFVLRDDLSHKCFRHNSVFNGFWRDFAIAMVKISLFLHLFASFSPKLFEI